VGKCVYFTAYNDQVDVAERLVGILPAYVAKMVDEAAAKQWFHPDSLHALQSVQFLSDDNGDWDGTWMTPDDELMQDILDEDMGVNMNFEFDGLSGLEHQVVSLTADEASVTTYGNALRVDSQQTGSGSLVGSATAARSGRGGQAD